MAGSTEIGLDTSVVVRLLVREPPELAAIAAEATLRARRNGARIIVSDLVVTEAYFALHTMYGVPKKAALFALAGMFAFGEVQPEPGGCAPLILNDCLASGSKPGFVDRMIHAQYRLHGARLMTFEKASGKLPGVAVL